MEITFFRLAHSAKPPAFILSTCELPGLFFIGTEVDDAFGKALLLRWRGELCRRRRTWYLTYQPEGAYGSSHIQISEEKAGKFPHALT